MIKILSRVNLISTTARRTAFREDGASRHRGAYIHIYSYIYIYIYIYRYTYISTIREKLKTPLENHQGITENPSKIIRAITENPSKITAVSRGPIRVPSSRGNVTLVITSWLSINTNQVIH